MAFGTRRRRVRRKNRVLWILLCIILFLFIFSLGKVQRFGKEKIPQTLQLGVSRVSAMMDVVQGRDRLAEAIQSVLKNEQGSYAVVIKNLKTGETYTLNPHRSFPAASLYKLWVMGSAYQQIQAGTLDPDMQLSGDVSDLNDQFDISSDSADLTDGTVQVTVDSALRQMITISHNYSALLLTDTVGISTISAYMKQQGLLESTLGETDGELPSTTAADTAAFLEKLYLGKLASKQYTDEMISLLKDQQLNEKLPKSLPDGAVVAHKTGELDSVSHDAGIVYTKKGDYVIVVLSETDAPDHANDVIATVSKAAYDYFIR